MFVADLRLHPGQRPVAATRSQRSSIDTITGLRLGLRLSVSAERLLVRWPAAEQLTCSASPDTESEAMIVLKRSPLCRRRRILSSAAGRLS